MLPNKKRGQKNLNDLAKYSGIAFQMILIICGGTFLGVKIDKWLEFEKYTFTVILALLSVLFAMYYMIKDLIKF